jgi:hypothetical protein
VSPAAVVTPPAPHDIQVSVVSAEEAALGVAEFWSDGRLIGFTRIEDGGFAVRIEASHDGVVLSADAVAGARAEAYRLLALYPAHD